MQRRVAMSDDVVRNIVSGLEKRECSNKDKRKHIVIDSYVPKARGMSVAERLRNMYQSQKNFNTNYK